jgi:hypothetical protein
VSAFTKAIYDALAADATLVAMLATYEGSPAIFTSDPAPGDTALPMVVSAGEVSQVPNDTKTSRGRSLIRDVRCYADASGSEVVIEAIAERVRAILHRQPLSIDGFTWLISDVTGPVIANEPDYMGRILSLSLTAQEV